MSAITVDDLHFSLHAKAATYSFLVSENNDLIHSHFGGPSHSIPSPAVNPGAGGWQRGPPTAPGQAQKEFPDLGRGDFGQPAIRIRHANGCTSSAFKYVSHKIVEGKAGIPGLPATYGDASSASTLLVTLRDEVGGLSATLSYAVFPDHNAFVRSMSIENESGSDIVIEAAASFSVDLGHAPLGRDMVQLSGDWAREAQIVRRKIQPGLQGIQSLAGFSSHLHNPFLGVVSPATDERSGEAIGFSLVYSGSFSAMVERSSSSQDRILIGLNPLHLSWPLKSGESFVTPEAVAVYSEQGLGGMSRSFHRLYRNHLSRSPWTLKDRPVLINNWEATYFDFDSDKIFRIAEQASSVGVQLLVLDDGWFGSKYPRNSDTAGLGDWKVNDKKLKGGLDALVKRINSLRAVDGENMQFGLWVEPEHVNPLSELYETHPDWILRASPANGRYYPPIQQRNQYILDLSQKQVQDHLIKVIGDLIASTKIAYIKWDCNKGIDQLPSPSTSHAYLLGLYRVVDALTTRFPDVLWEGCASGGGRFDPGLLHYWPGSWTSDCTDPVDRLFIQSGTSMVYPASSMSGHVSASPNHQTGRETPLEFRAHVAMMCGSFGFELDPATFTPDELKTIPGLIQLSQRISPLIVKGDLYRLARPDESNWPAFLYVSEDATEAVLLAYQIHNTINVALPAIRLDGLLPHATYTTDDGDTYGGDTLMNAGLRLPFKGDYQSKVVFFKQTRGSTGP